VAGYCEYGNELSGSIKCDRFLDQLSELSASEERLFHEVSWSTVSLIILKH
jgi:hypothetical protein